MIKIQRCSDLDNELKTKLKDALKFLYGMYLSKCLQLPYELNRPSRRNCSIDSFDDSQCWNFFEFRKEDLFRLFRPLNFPSICYLSNKSVMSGEEIFLRGLYELVSGEDQFNISENVFGRDQSIQSRAFKYFVDHIHENFYYLLTDNLEWWFIRGYVSRSQVAVNNKLRDLGLTYPEGKQTAIFGFIDCNCLETCRVGGGPTAEGPDADRWDDNFF